MPARRSSEARTSPPCSADLADADSCTPFGTSVSSLLLESWQGEPADREAAPTCERSLTTAGIAPLASDALAVCCAGAGAVGMRIGMGAALPPPLLPPPCWRRGFFGVSSDGRQPGVAAAPPPRAAASAETRSATAPPARASSPSSCTAVKTSRGCALPAPALRAGGGGLISPSARMDASTSRIRSAMLIARAEAAAKQVAMERKQLCTQGRCGSEACTCTEDAQAKQGDDRTQAAFHAEKARRQWNKSKREAGNVQR
eukprot:353529-Chlamydomonas_euryale.AAC.19